jgi:hypothetical protein
MDIERRRFPERDVVLPPHINDSPYFAAAPDCSSPFEKELPPRIDFNFIEQPAIEFIDNGLGKHCRNSEPADDKVLWPWDDVDHPSIVPVVESGRGAITLPCRCLIPAAGGANSKYILDFKELAFEFSKVRSNARYSPTKDLSPRSSAGKKQIQFQKRECNVPPRETQRMGLEDSPKLIMGKRTA